MLHLIGALLIIGTGQALQLPPALRNRTWADAQPRIISGEDADIADFPYVLSLRYFDFHVCGASIISDSWALTAGNCVDFDIDPEILTLLAGSTNKSGNQQIIQVSDYTVHPRFDSFTYQFNIAVVRGMTSFTGTNIAPVRLVTSGLAMVPGHNAWATGWGLMSNGLQSDVLQKIEIPFVNQASCVSQWEGDVDDSMICAGSPAREPCSADTGGPLVYCGLQVGIISWGEVDCRGPRPSVFTSLANPEIRSFIRSTTGV